MTNSNIYQKRDIDFQLERVISEMGKLQNALKRVSENWNDVVAQGIQTMQVNQVISSCNSLNSIMSGSVSEINADMSRLEELQSICLSRSY